MICIGCGRSFEPDNDENDPECEQFCPACRGEVIGCSQDVLGPGGDPGVTKLRHTVP